MGSSARPETMFAWRKHRGNPEPIWEEVPVPKPTPTGVLVKILASGVCRSDRSLLSREKQAGWFQDKWTLGHEGCGRIVEFGADVKDTTLKVICERGQHCGIGQDGYYAPYATIDIRGVVLVPEGVTPAEAAVATDAVNTAYHAITRRGEVKASETVFLFGLGGLGFNALQIIHNIGARVIVSDIRQQRLDEAIKLGIPEADIVPVGKSPVEFVAERGLLVDTVADFVGTHQTFDDAQDIVRRGGKILCIGSIDSENTVHMKTGTRKRLSYIFSYGGQVEDLKEVLDLIAKGVIRPQVQPGKLEDFPTVLKNLEDGKVEARVALIQDE
ncbi:hypothetical protein NEMBOFW57_010790 [Staphylotrichum longicolle]|uniref:Enoyl reductase (ER) domain-containing protein n=1 Tax=Staphylotrichum longicolle TaxID=669026 RepID=A0AAD4HUJ1_9PEZI|nr:hypothetical protein NEMBOFW57_010790 [Staphylotrichum longicolle]